jgi:hypothetical protein
MKNLSEVKYIIPFHLMMMDGSEVAGGYVIRYKTKGIEAELDWHKIEIPNREEL